jgi:hypothetical protein
MAKKPDPKTVAGFLAREKEDWQTLSGLWAGLPEKDLTRPGACGEWSIKDVMNHIASWQDATREVIPVLLAGGKLPKGKYAIGKFNPANYLKYHKLPLAVSKRRLRRSRRLLLKFLSGVPKKQLLDSKHGAGLWAKYGTYGHYREHLRPLMRFRRLILKDVEKGKSKTNK